MPFSKNRPPHYSLEEVRRFIENRYTDITLDHIDPEKGWVMVYSDPGGVTLDNDDGTFHYINFDEMLKAPVFWGKTLPEVLDIVNIHTC